MSLKNPVTPRGIDPGTVRLVEQRLNHYITPGPKIKDILVQIHNKHLVQWNSTEKISVISYRFVMRNTKTQLHFRFAVPSEVLRWVSEDYYCNIMEGNAKWKWRRKIKRRDESKQEEKIDYTRIMKTEGGKLKENKWWQNWTRMVKDKGISSFGFSLECKARNKYAKLLNMSIILWLWDFGTYSCTIGTFTYLNINLSQMRLQRFHLIIDAGI
jgi:hypothetical protein